MMAQDESGPRAESSLKGTLGRLKARLLGTPYIFYFAILVLIAFLADPYSFTRAWNQGRSAMLAIVPLVFLEAGKRSLSQLQPGRKPLLAWLTLIVAAAFYFIVSQPLAANSIVSLGRSL